MVRITKEELEQLKSAVMVERLALARGLELEPHNGNLVARCPFHEAAGDERSLVIRPSTNTWECRGACKTRGTVIDWVMSAEKVQLRGAVEILRRELAAQNHPVDDLAAAPPPSPTPTPIVEPPPASEPDELVVEREDRRYRVRGLERSKHAEQMRVNLQVRRGAAFFVDSLDLYQARQRGGFERQAAVELSVREEVVKRDLNELVQRIEALQDERRRKPTEPSAATLSQDAIDEAMALLQDPRLMLRIVGDFARSGIVGEEMNAVVAYLVVTSRKLDKPLAAVVQSSSSAGKSSLMDAVLAFVPEEDRIKYSAMTGQSLFYMGETNLRHKVLAIVEEEGARRAGYALKLLQSEGELTIAVPMKDPNTGDIATKEKHVEGPVAMMMTTTAIDVGEELMNRCIVLAVNEGREQTQAIHRLQREARTLQGLLRRAERDRVLTVHRNAQRLLRPLAVVNEYAPRLRFVDGRTRSRRDHAKYLTLIDTIALLHQHQRPIRTADVCGKPLEYIEVTAEDVRLANELANEVLGRSLDEMPPQTRLFLEAMHRWVSERRTAEGGALADFRFTRRELRDATGASYDQVRVHLERLIDLEYVLVHRGRTGQSFVYELAYDGEGADGGRFVLGLIDPHAPEPNLGGQNGHLGGPNGDLGGPLVPHWGPFGGRLGTDRTRGSGLKTRQDARSGESDPESHRGTGANGAAIGAGG